LSKLANDSFIPRLTQPLKRYSWGILGIAILLLLAGAGQAQTTANIAGTAHDTTWALVPGAKVVLVDEGSKAQWTTNSNGEGFLTLPPSSRQPTRCGSAVRVLKPGR